MALWIETKVKFHKIAENGISKQVTETYLVNALTFTEAEARITKEMEQYISGDFTVSAVSKTKIAELFKNPQGDRWYEVKVAFITIDEKTAVEKRSYSYILVQANDFDGAVASFKDGMKGSMADYEIAFISETRILDIFDFAAETD